MSLSLRKATAADSRMVFDWRNHETVRLASIDTRELDWDGHQDWFQRSLQRQDRHLLIAEQEFSPVGVLRLDIEGIQAAVSIFTDPDLTGQGLGTQILEEGVRYCRDNLRNVTILCAKVRSENSASMRIFEKVGFVFQGMSESWRVYELAI